MFGKMLIPLDASEISPGILPHASYLAKGLGIPVTLMCVIDPDSLDTQSDSAGTDYTRLDPRDYSSLTMPLVGYTGDEWSYRPSSRPPGDASPGMTRDATSENIEGAHRAVREWLEGFAQGLRQEGIMVETHAVLPSGDSPAQDILGFARTQGCDIIAMATHDRNLLGQAIRGSVTNEVIRTAETPVLAVTPEKGSLSPGQKAGINNIVVPLDGSDFAESALEYAQELALRLRLPLILLRAAEYRDVYPMGSPATPLYQADPRMYEVAEDTVQDDMTRYLQHIAAQVEQEGIDVQWQVVQGDPTSAIQLVLEQQTPGSLIALASHGRSGVTRWVMGSVAEGLLRSTGEPVLVIPATVVEEMQPEYPPA